MKNKHGHDEACQLHDAQAQVQYTSKHSAELKINQLKGSLFKLKCLGAEWNGYTQCPQCRVKLCVPHSLCGVPAYCLSVVSLGHCCPRIISGEVCVCECVHMYVCCDSE